MTIILYGIVQSPILRGTLLTIEALGLEIDFKEVNTLLGDQFKPEFLKLNPLHTIPTIEDGDFVLWDSHAINSYLVDKYGKDDTLYPKDLQKRAVVNQRLYFNCGVVFPRLLAVAMSLIKDGARTVPKELADSLVDVYNSLETFLERSTYVAGEEITIADFSLVATITSANVLVPIATNGFPKISEWLTKIQALPFYASGNQVGLDKFSEFFKSKIEYTNVSVYGMNASPVVRGTLVTIEALGLDFERVEVNTVFGDQFKPEFLKLNPFHTIPTIQDGDFVIWDSHAINSYLVDKYGKDDSFYPKDLQKRAVVNQRLYFDCVLFPKLAAVFFSIKRGEPSVSKELADPLIEAYTSLETLLERSTYAAGEHVTIADFSLVATLSSANVVVPIESNRFPRVTQWLTEMQALPYYASGNQVGLDRLIAGINNKFETL